MAVNQEKQNAKIAELKSRKGLIIYNILIDFFNLICYINTILLM